MTNIDPTSVEASGTPLTSSAHRPWLWPAVTGVAGLAAGLVLGSVLTGAVTAAQQAAAVEAAAVAAEEVKSTFFADAASTCHIAAAVEVTDGGRTMIVDGKGEDAGSGPVTLDQLDCIIGAVGTPDSVHQKMYKTRSLDGRQSGEWDDVSASWSYHPDDGLDIIFELSD